MNTQIIVQANPQHAKTRPGLRIPGVQGPGGEGRRIRLENIWRESQDVKRRRQILNTGYYHYYEIMKPKTLMLSKCSQLIKAVIAPLSLSIANGPDLKQMTVPSWVGGEFKVSGTCREVIRVRALRP